jgi:hypothetical protein
MNQAYPAEKIAIDTRRDHEPGRSVRGLVPHQRATEALDDLGQRIHLHERTELLRDRVDAYRRRG